ncbi:hypothetical protein RIF29_14941 [Crotalaria pallida]|uniref:Uncharacterized protein n=1 Tax=Crotalaria pallida TaxID=3830 RepID=A0AAN9IC53_CROPI
MEYQNQGKSKIKIIPEENIAKADEACKEILSITPVAGAIGDNANSGFKSDVGSGAEANDAQSSDARNKAGSDGSGASLPKAGAVMNYDGWTPVKTRSKANARIDQKKGDSKVVFFKAASQRIEQAVVCRY